MGTGTEVHCPRLIGIKVKIRVKVLVKRVQLEPNAHTELEWGDPREEAGIALSPRNAVNKWGILQLLRALKV